MATAPAIEPASIPNPSEALFLKLKEQFGMYIGGEFERYASRLPAAQHIVEGLLPRRSVNILVGDSGLGKSPLAYQLALAAASGQPFLGFATRPSKVLLVDYENAPWDSRRILEQQRRHLGLAEYPSPNFLFWPVRHEPDRGGIDPVIRQLAPDLVILDSLRSFCPEMESDNAAAVRRIKILREIATRSETAVLLIHHLRKDGARDGRNIFDWLLRTSGARALVNQTDVRLALVPAKDTEADVILHGHYRTRGEIGPYLLRRWHDGDGEPLGYERVTAGPALLQNADYEAVFERLPASFSFKEARMIYGRQDSATSLFLQKLVRVGLLHKERPGHYRKVREVEA